MPHTWLKEKKAWLRRRKTGWWCLRLNLPDVQSHMRLSPALLKGWSQLPCIKMAEGNSHFPMKNDTVRDIPLGWMMRLGSESKVSPKGSWATAGDPRFLSQPRLLHQSFSFCSQTGTPSPLRYHSVPISYFPRPLSAWADCNYLPWQSPLISARPQ